MIFERWINSWIIDLLKEFQSCSLSPGERAGVRGSGNSRLNNCGRSLFLNYAHFSK